MYRYMFGESGLEFGRDILGVTPEEIKKFVDIVLKKDKLVLVDLPNVKENKRPKKQPSPAGLGKGPKP